MKNKLMNLVLIIYLLCATDVFAKVIDITQDSNVNQIINGAFSGDTIRFFPGTYAINILLGDKNLTLVGADTKNTILKADDSSKAIISFEGTSAGSIIQNFTFVEADIGILVADSTLGFVIKNSVFRLGSSNMGIKIGTLSSVNVLNNTFYGNSTNIETDSRSIIIKNNIFDEYDTLISGLTPDVITFNCISTNATEYATNNQINTTATFVDDSEDVNDFHLKEDSRCIDSGEGKEDHDGSRTDIGAYGGSDFDKIPDSSFIETVDNADPSAVVVTWIKNEDYQVEGYKLYYDTLPIYSETQDTYLNLTDREADLSIFDAELELSVTLTDLDSDPKIPDAPVLNEVVPGNNKLSLSWSAVENTTSYLVYYTTGDAEPKIEKDIAETRYEIVGLSNGVVYTVWVQANNKLDYYFQVAAYIGDPDDDEFAESYFVREDKKLDIAQAVSSEFSNKKSAEPESVVAYPPLSGEGCFIATAAFGYYSAPQVQVLRDFRDKYLLTSEPGRALVSWYYHYGPYGADIINDYAILKVLTRVALYPLILAVQLLEKTIAGFILLISFYLMLILLAISAVVMQFRKRVCVI